MTKTSLYITNSIFTWIALVAVACFFVATQNSSNAYWTVDYGQAMDSEHRGCLSTAQSGYNVSFGLALSQRTAAIEAAYTIFQRSTDPNAEDDYNLRVGIAHTDFNNAVRTAESIANDAVGDCRDDAVDRAEARAAAAEAERQRQAALQQQSGGGGGGGDSSYDQTARDAENSVEDRQEDLDLLNLERCLDDPDSCQDM